MPFLHYSLAALVFQVDLVVQFQSGEVGTFTDTFVFEVVGGEQVSLVATGSCDYPRISTEHR